MIRARSWHIVTSALLASACSAPGAPGSNLRSASTPAPALAHHTAGAGRASALPAAASADPDANTAMVAGPCPPDMVDVAVACIDRFEAPNVAGEKPLRMQSATDGEAWCAERGKRLCTEDEWVRACEGPARLAFPYGRAHEPGRCNDDGRFIAARWGVLARWPADEARAEADRLDQSHPSGARSGCVSAEGVSDLSGNVAEWVVRTRENPTNHTHVVKGCFWGKCFRPPHTPRCDYVNYAHPTGFRSYEMGFRCCRARAP